MKAVLAAAFIAPSTETGSRRHPLAALAGAWRRLLRRVTDPYRPEKHYMRGPGPAWRARHGVKP